MDVWARIDGGHYANTVFAIPNNHHGGTQSPRGGVREPATGSLLFCWVREAAQIKPVSPQFPATDKHLLGWYLQDSWKVKQS